MDGQATAWMTWALCHETDPDLFFPDQSDPISSRRAKAICHGCPVRAECLDWAITHRELGVWGGTTEAERRDMKRRPETAGLELAA